MTLTPIEFAAQFVRAYKKKPKALQQKIEAAVTQLRIDWRHPGLRTKPVQGAKGIFEARVDRGNRLTFEWENDTIVLRMNCDREIVGRKP